MYKQSKLLVLVVSFIAFSCKVEKKARYGNVLELIQDRTQLYELRTNNGNSRVLVSPEYQGKVLTSSNKGLQGESFGWLNWNALSQDHLSGAELGGEDRLWIGPLGSQFSFFYQHITPLSEDNWKVPVSMNAEPYKLLSYDSVKITMEKDMKLTNFIGTKFNLSVNRQIEIYSKLSIEKNLSIKLSDEIDYVAYQSSHRLVNKGNAIQNETGLVSLWSAGMFEGSAKGVVIIPLQKVVTKQAIFEYMGNLDSSRFEIIDDVILFKADGKYRSKLGIPPHIAKSVYGCYRPELNTLTIIQYALPKGDSLYFNSEVSVQENPYMGEAIPIYNNGPMDYLPTDETSFFELESTSAMKELQTGDTLSHYHRIYHFTASYTKLDELAIEILGISLTNCKLR